MPCRLRQPQARYLVTAPTAGAVTNRAGRNNCENSKGQLLNMRIVMNHLSIISSIMHYCYNNYYYCYTVIGPIGVRHSGGPPFRRSAIPGVRHSGLPSRPFWHLSGLLTWHYLIIPYANPLINVKVYFFRCSSFKTIPLLTSKVSVEWLWISTLYTVTQYM